MMPRAAPRRATIATIAIICVPGIPVARAQEASAWETVPHAAARLIAGATFKSADVTWLRAGIEIRLDPGWKTYWRYPGDSGVPPTFDFASSENVKSVTVLWPAPERFADGAGGYSIGYLGDVVFPLWITPKDTAKPFSLHVKLGYAVCSNLCLLAEADLDLALSGKGGAEEPALLVAEARAPRRVPFGAGTQFAIRSAHREGGDGRERVVVEVAAPEGKSVDLLVEGPTPDWALPLPEPTTSAPGSASGLRRFTFNLDGLPSGVHADGATLTFTAISPDDAIEVSVHLK